MMAILSFGDLGSAARFFYTAKADSDDRLGSKHPTVKPLDLMQYLVRLATPRGGLVLDPFAGTGTTGEAACREGMCAVLIEREAEYQADIRRRMALVLSWPRRARATGDQTTHEGEARGSRAVASSPIGENHGDHSRNHGRRERAQELRRPRARSGRQGWEEGWINAQKSLPPVARISSAPPTAARKRRHRDRPMARLPCTTRCRRPVVASQVTAAQITGAVKPC